MLLEQPVRKQEKQKYVSRSQATSYREDVQSTKSGSKSCNSPSYIMRYCDTAKVPLHKNGTACPEKRYSCEKE